MDFRYCFIDCVLVHNCNIGGLLFVSLCTNDWNVFQCIHLHFMLHNNNNKNYQHHYYYYYYIIIAIKKKFAYFLHFDLSSLTDPINVEGSARVGNFRRIENVPLFFSCEYPHKMFVPNNYGTKAVKTEMNRLWTRWEMTLNRSCCFLCVYFIRKKWVVQQLVTY